MTWRFTAGWAAAVAAASAWWLLPLLLLGRYGPPFYQYVESASNTTSLIGWSEAVRGATHWVAYLVDGGQPWWPGAYFLVSNDWMIVVSAAIAAVGLVGLARHPSELRLPLVLSAAFCLGVITVAHGGPAGSVISTQALHALDGSLQILRNVHKFDPAIRLAVAIGFGAVASGTVARMIARWPRLLTSRPLLLAVPTALVLALMAPMVLNQTRTPGWTDIPRAWHQTAEYVAQHRDGRSALVVPGSGFAQQTWGWTMDEPSVALDIPGRVSLSQIPLVPGQSIRFVSALNRLLTSGTATVDLSRQLARAGVGLVVVRRDLDRQFSASPSPGGVDVSLTSPGLTKVATYGEFMDGGPRSTSTRSMLPPNGCTRPTSTTYAPWRASPSRSCRSRRTASWRPRRPRSSPVRRAGTGSRTS